MSDRRVLLCGVSAVALALVGIAPSPVLAQMIIHGGGNGGTGGVSAFGGTPGVGGDGGIAGGGAYENGARASLSVRF